MKTCSMIIQRTVKAQNKNGREKNNKPTKDCIRKWKQK